jgi:hypothetical protein
MKIPYEVPKVDRRSQQGGPVYIREEDTKMIRAKDVLDAAKAKKGFAPAIWKSHFWGTWRDLRLLARLNDLPRLDAYVGTARNPKRFIKGTGFQPFNPRPDSDIEKIRKKKEPEKPWWPPETLFFSADTPADLVVPPDLCEPIGNRFPLVLFARDPRIFTRPKVLLSKGSGRALYSSGMLLFQDALTAIAGDASDAHLLRFLAAVLGSDLIHYYLFHTNSNLGIYRPQVYPKEFLSVPFFLPQDASDPKEAQEIVDQAATAICDFERRLESGSWFGRDEDTSRIRREVLNPLVRKYYDIDEKYEAMLIEDTLRLAKPSSTPTENTRRIPTLAGVDENGCRLYADTLCEMLNNFGHTSGFKVRSEVLLGSPYSIVHVCLVNKGPFDVSISRSGHRLDATLRRLGALLEKQGGQFIFCQNLKIFDGDSLYVLKPMQMRFWSATAALNDADEIAGAIVNWRGSH